MDTSDTNTKICAEKKTNRGKKRSRDAPTLLPSSPAKLGRLAAIAVSGGTMLREGSSLPEKRWKRSYSYCSQFSVHETADGTGIRLGPATAASTRMLSGENSLLCSLLSWETFPEHLTVSINDNGSIGADSASSGATDHSHYIYRIRHEGNEILHVDRKLKPYSSVCAQLGIEPTTPMSRAPFCFWAAETASAAQRKATERAGEFTWTSDWCVSGQVPERIVSEHVRLTTGLPDVLSDIVTGYYNRGKYETPSEYGARVRDRIRRQVLADLGSHGVSIQLVAIHIVAVSMVVHLVSYDRISESAVYRPWMKGLNMPVKVCRPTLFTPTLEEPMSMYVYRVAAA